MARQICTTRVNSASPARFDHDARDRSAAVAIDREGVREPRLDAARDGVVTGKLVDRRALLDPLNRFD